MESASNSILKNYKVHTMATPDPATLLQNHRADNNIFMITDATPEHREIDNKTAELISNSVIEIQDVKPA